MNLHLTTVQLLVGGFALVIVAILAVTEILESRRENKHSSLNHPRSEFDQNQHGKNDSWRNIFTVEHDEWHT